MACFLAIAASKSVCIAFSDSLTMSSSPCALVSFCIATLSLPSATLSAAIFGFTSLEMAV